MKIVYYVSVAILMALATGCTATKQTNVQQPAPLTAPNNAVANSNANTAAPLTSRPAVHKYSLESLRAVTRVAWNTVDGKPLVPDSFDVNQALATIVNKVYAYPPYTYAKLDIEITNAKSPGSERAADARLKKQFLYDIIVNATVEPDGTCDNFYKCDDYLFSSRYDPAAHTYTIEEPEVEIFLAAVPSDIRAQALKLIGLPTEDFVSGLDIAWLHAQTVPITNESHEVIQRVGVQDGALALTQTEVDGSGPELGIRAVHSWIVDPFAKTIIWEKK